MATPITSNLRQPHKSAQPGGSNTGSFGMPSAFEKMVQGGADKQVKDMGLMLTTALKNQTPDNQTDMFQLIQVSMNMMQIASQTQSNEYLKSLAESNKTAQDVMASQFVGQKISHVSDEFTLDSRGQQEFEYTVPQQATKGYLRITPVGSNHAVQEYTLEDLRKHNGKIIWDGLTDSGEPAPKGEYTASLVLMNENEPDIEKQRIYVPLVLNSFVTSVKYESDSPPILYAGNTPIRDLKARKFFEYEGASASASASKVYRETAAQTEADTHEQIDPSKFSSFSQAREHLTKTSQGAQATQSTQANFNDFSI